MDTLKSSFNESGFSLIEILISMLIFLIMSAGVSYALIESNQQMSNVVHLLNGEQYGMAKSVSNVSPSNPAFNTSFSGTETSTSLPITLTLNPVQPTQACTPGLLNGIGQTIGNFFSGLLCFFGGCQTTTATPSPTSYTVSVPVTAITTSSSQIAWWNP